MLNLFKIFWRKSAKLSGGVENTFSLRYPQKSDKLLNLEIEVAI